jgi:membrane-bound serine protease (ClpP class)
MQTVAILIAAGAVLLLLETILPGMIAGAIGLMCLLAAVVLGYVNFGPRTGSFILLGVGAGFVAGFLIWLKVFPNSRVARVFVSQRAVGDLGVERKDLIGHTGSALTPLRPSGMANINGRRVDVVTEGGHIDRGTPVKVVAVEGMRVVVRAV